MSNRGPKPKPKQIPAGEAYANFANSLKTRPTLTTYLYCLKQYMTFRKLDNLDYMISKDRENTKLAETLVKEFILSVKSRGVTAGHINTNFNAIKHFYIMNDVLMNWRKLSKFRFALPLEEGNSDIIRSSSGTCNKNGLEKKKDRAYTYEEIQKMLSVASHKMKAMILLFASTGMRIGAVPPLRLRHLTKVENYGLYQIQVYENSSEEYLTFCSPEAAAAIDSYLSYRKRAGERLTPDSILFRTDFDPEDHFQTKSGVRPLRNAAAISSAFCRILRETGISPRITLMEGQRSGSVTKEVKRVHGFRKFANTMMVQSDMKGAAKEMILGHSIGLDDKYYRPTPGQLLEEYLKAVDLLTINEENRLKKKVEVLKAERDDRLSVIETQMQAIVSALGTINQSGKNEIAKQLVERSVYRPMESNPNNNG